MILTLVGRLSRDQAEPQSCDAGIAKPEFSSQLSEAVSLGKHESFPVWQMYHPQGGR
jgi:hypothetical protein